MREHPDFLRTPSNIFDPDPRNIGLEILGEKGFRPKTLQDQYDALVSISLHDRVPREIVVKFETAKNLNLFSWFVYRFHAAATSHVNECLELALRMRFKNELLAHEEKKRQERYEEEVRRNPQSAKRTKPIDRESFRPGLRNLLDHAISIGALKNEGFSVWQLRTKVRARSRRDVEAIQRMAELGLTEIKIDDAVEVTDADRDYDYLSVLLENIPALRNHYAHGTSALDNKSLDALRLAAEIINQIFPGARIVSESEHQGA